MSYYGYIRDDENSLCHHGIKGQKWGVRRYQNPDGSLTPEGMRRYAHMQSRDTDSSATKKAKADWFSMDENQFRAKYKVGKDEYSRRVKKYGDPFMNSPMAKYAKKKSDARSKYKTYMKMQNELQGAYDQIVADPRHVSPELSEKYNNLVAQNSQYLKENRRQIRSGKRMEKRIRRYYY